jgi:hypothetical protein
LIGNKRGAVGIGVLNLEVVDLFSSFSGRSKIFPSSDAVASKSSMPVKKSLALYSSAYMVRSLE